MPVKIYIIPLLLFNLFCFFDRAYGQDFPDDSKLSLQFIKNNIEVTPGEVFHNVLIVTNNDDKTRNVNLFLNTPHNWRTFGESSQNLTLSPGKRIYLPVQVFASNKSRGGVGYAVIATVNDINGNMIAGENCFLSIPRSSKVNATVSRQDRNFDLQTKKASFSLKIKNEGNTDQQISIKTNPGPSLEIPGSDLPFASKTFHLEPKQDSTLSFTVKLKDDVNTDLFRNHDMTVNVSGSDTLIKKTIWFNYLDWQYTNNISETKRPLIIEAHAENLFAKSEPTYRLRAYGNILFKNEHSLQYNVFNWKNSNTENNPIISSVRASVTYRYADKTVIKAGDISDDFEKRFFGKGISVKQKFKKHDVLGIVTQNIHFNETNTGAKYNYRFNFPLRIGLGAAISKNKTTNRNSVVYFSEGSSSIPAIGNIKLRYGYSKTDSPGNPDASERIGYGITAQHSYSKNKLSIRNNLRYGSPTYVGINRGRFYINSIAHSNLKNQQSLTANYTKQQYLSSSAPEQSTNDNYVSTDTYEFNYKKNITENIQLHTGPYFKNNATNSYSVGDQQTIFTAREFGGKAGIGLFEKHTVNAVNVRFKYGFVTTHSQIESTAEQINNRQTDNFEVSLSIKRKLWHLYSAFTNGPKNTAEYYAYALSGYSGQSLMVMPSYSNFIYEDIAEMVVRGTYMNNLTAGNTRVYLSTRLNLHLKKGWSAYLENSFSAISQKQTNSSAFTPKAHTSNFFRIGIKKIFNFNQPRINYINLDAVFYRDNNGDGNRTADEPGVSNVLASVKRIPEENEASDIKSEFNSVELLSEFEGKIALEDIPAGSYQIEYIPTKGKEGNFITDRAVKTVKIKDDSTLHIPFTDRNRVYGNVIIKEAENSILENPPLDNIKIVAKGGGKTFSTLTDEKGYFEMYIPLTDYYRIETTNIDPEHYTLQQSFYVIKFNGYKEFELNFIFEEKERTVNFEDDFAVFDTEEETDQDTTSYDDDTEEVDVQPIRHLKLKGKVRDENTSEPMHAQVSIINQTNGRSLAETVSSHRTGIYAAELTLTQADQLFIKAKTNGYWSYKETVRISTYTTFSNIEKDIRLKPIITGETIDAPNLLFESNSAAIQPAAEVELESLLKRLHENNQIVIDILGHSDNDEAKNESETDISAKRAQAVAQYLQKGGIHPDRINRVTGKSNKAPKAGESKAANRRVEIVVSNF